MTTPFDAATWSDPDVFYDPPFPRRAMARDLIARHLTEGQPRAEIEALLGPRTDTPYFADRGLIYWLGTGGDGLGVDAEWLAMDFDAQDRLVRFEIVTD